MGISNQPYTYLIGWSKLNKWYYGCRFAKGCSPSDLWKTYFTSSKYVKRFREENGEPDIIEIRKTFDCVEKAGLWESKVLRRLAVINDEKWLNKTTNKIHDRTGTLHSEETKLKMSAARKRNRNAPMKGKKHSDKTRVKMSQSRKEWLMTDDGKLWLSKNGNKEINKYISEDTRKRINTDPVIILKRIKSNTGQKRSLETRKNMSCAMKKAWQRRKGDVL